MSHLLGIPIGGDDARWLIAALYRDAHALTVAAALMLEKGVVRDLYAVGLTLAERTAVLALPRGSAGRGAERSNHVAPGTRFWLRDEAAGFTGSLIRRAVASAFGWDGIGGFRM